DDAAGGCLREVAADGAACHRQRAGSFDAAAKKGSAESDIVGNGGRGDGPGAAAKESGAEVATAGVSGDRRAIDRQRALYLRVDTGPEICPIRGAETVVEGQDRSVV